jgi:hypothetical protein
MYSNTADWSSSLEGQLRRLTSSFLSVAKNVSATALSYASPWAPIETAIPASPAALPNARLTLPNSSSGLSSTTKRVLQLGDRVDRCAVGGRHASSC